MEDRAPGRRDNHRNHCGGLVMVALEEAVFPYMSLPQKSEVALDMPSGVRLKRRQLRRC